MTDLNNRPIEAEIDFDSDGNAYYSEGIYLDTSEPVPYEILQYLSEIYPEDLEDAEYDRSMSSDEEARFFGSN